MARRRDAITRAITEIRQVMQEENAALQALDAEIRRLTMERDAAIARGDNDAGRMKLSNAVRQAQERKVALLDVADGTNDRLLQLEGELGESDAGCDEPSE